MSQTAIGFLSGGILATIGVSLWALAPLLAKLNIWGQSQFGKPPLLKWLAKFAYDEQTSITFIRGVGVAAVVAGFLVPIIAIVTVRTR